MLSSCVTCWEPAIHHFGPFKALGRLSGKVPAPTKACATEILRASVSSTRTCGKSLPGFHVLKLRLLRPWPPKRRCWKGASTGLQSKADFGIQGQTWDFKTSMRPDVRPHTGFMNPASPSSLGLKAKAERFSTVRDVFKEVAACNREFWSKSLVTNLAGCAEVCLAFLVSRVGHDEHLQR